MREQRCLFQQLNFQLKAGELLQVAGANGSGKSTLLKLLSSLIVPTEGLIRWNNNPLEECKESYHADLIYLGHQPAIKANLTVQENLIFSTVLHNAKKDFDIEELLSLLKLQNNLHTPAGQLSAGQQRRLSLAKLWLVHAKIWILDEPFTSLDKLSIQLIKNKIAEFLSRGGIVILATHHIIDLPGHQVKFMELG